MRLRGCEQRARGYYSDAEWLNADNDNGQENESCKHTGTSGGLSGALATLPGEGWLDAPPTPCLVAVRKRAWRWSRPDSADAGDPGLSLGRDTEAMRIAVIVGQEELGLVVVSMDEF